MQAYRKTGIDSTFQFSLKSKIKDVWEGAEYDCRGIQWKFA